MSMSIAIKDHLLGFPITVAPHADLSDAVQLILRNKVSGICVVDDNKQLIGMLSELDCLKGLMAATYNRSNAGTVSEYMTPNVDVVHLHDNIINVADDMLKKNQRRRPVVENGKLIGQITCRQLLNVVEEFSRSNSFA